MDLLYDIALRCLHVPYLWGGKNPMVGVDCSGLVEYLLHSVGLELPTGPNNAQQLHDFLSQPANHRHQNPEIGSIVFFGSNRRAIDHCGLCLSKRLMVEAGGGSSVIVNADLAVRAKAFVKVVPIPFGQRFIGAFMPEYSFLNTP